MANSEELRQEELRRLREELSHQSDASRLAEELGSTREQVQMLRAELLKAQAAGLTRTVFGALALFVLLGGFTGVAGYGLWKVMMTPSTVDRCIVERQNHEGLTGYKLSGNVEWGNNIAYGIYSTLDETLLAASRLGCSDIQQPTQK